MGQPLLCLVHSANENGSEPAPLGSASNDKRKRESGSSLTAVGTAGGWKVGKHARPAPSISGINLFHSSPALPRRRPNTQV